MASYSYGIHTIKQILETNPDTILELYVSQRQDRRMNELLALAQTQGIKPQRLDISELDKLSQGCNHQGVVAKIKNFAYCGENQLLAQLESLTEPALILALDGIQDPHNLGACLRTADAAGVHAILIPKNRSVGVTPSVQKVASGAAQSLPIYQVTNLVRSLEQLKQIGLWVVGTDQQGPESLHQADLSGPTVLVMGGEGKGMRQLSKKTCDLLVKIPMLGQVSSLNVSVATGVCLYEIQRQRHLNRS